MKSCTLVLALSLAAGAALAQDGPPTGIVSGGSVALLRTETKTSVGAAAPVEIITDFLVSGFRSTDYSKITQPPTPDITTIGPCVVSTIQPQTPSSQDPTAFKLLDAGPVLNVNGPNGSKQFPVNKFAYGGMLGAIGFPTFPGLPAQPPLSPLKN